jgi:hypothetical protein
MAEDKKEPTGRAKGGLKVAEQMTPEQKADRARKGAQARWGARQLQATHKGSFQQEFGIDVDCYVLNDQNKTAVIHQRGMGQALGLGESGSRLPRFVSGKAISNYLGPEIRQKLENPIIFQGLSAGLGGAPSTVHGYDVTLLIDLCKAIVQAESDGALMHHQAPVARQAHIILSASAKAGIKGLVYALAGYDITRDEVVKAFKLFVQQEAREYEREFPPQLYNEWYRLYELPTPERGRPWKAKFLTIDHVYFPLARSAGKVYELVQAQRAKDSEQKSKKLHQFLSELGVKALRTQVGQLLGIARISKTKEEYEQHVKTLFGDQLELPGIEPV